MARAETAAPVAARVCERSNHVAVPLRAAHATNYSTRATVDEVAKKRRGKRLIPASMY
ncbi:hypothetical protein [Caballeronia sp. INDeC2]|uniref:hypothetical protein n=1 Tax=Caballeronia sp. INDeC2 TaxID=2921747 RepID=UPI00202809DE|nr:hypothetical protein [Caballeronia sp. INDeC2]